MPVETLNFTTSRGATTAHASVPSEKPTAAIILIQEWWGINDHIRDVAGRYAKEGYLCVAPDLYRGKIARDPKEAGAMMQALAMEDGLETIEKAVQETKKTYGIQKFGITGFCMGGTFAFRAACELPDFSAAAPFYGDVPPEDVLKKLKTPELFIAGNKDGWINPQKVAALRQAAQKYNLPIEIVTYDADHAFFNDTRPEVYNREAAVDAWARVLAFFKKQLGQAAAKSA